MATLTQYNRPGGWNDPDLLIGPWCGIDHNQVRKATAVSPKDPCATWPHEKMFVVEQSFCGQSDLQARTQFSLWALFPAPLLISQNMLRWSAFALETYSNEEVYASATSSPGNSRK